VPAQLIATCLSLTGFAAALVGGLSAQNPAGVTLRRALVSMAACYAAGLLIGFVAQLAVQEHLDQYRSSHPLPESSESAGARQAAGGELQTESAVDVTPGPRRAAA
jgi:hypothetical protein